MHGPEEEHYVYVDESGKPLFFVCRYRDGDGKTFLQGRPTERGGVEWGLDGLEPTLYRRDELDEHLAAGSRDPVYVVEGEKAADALRARLREHGLSGVVTCNPMGAGKWRESFTDALRGARHVIVVADRDHVGEKHARTMAAELGPHVDRVELKRPAVDLDHAGVDDHLDAGLGLDELVDRAASPARRRR